MSQNTISPSRKNYLFTIILPGKLVQLKPMKKKDKKIETKNYNTI